MSPLGDTVCLVNGIERYFYLMQEGDIVLFGKRLRCKIEQLGLAGKHILTHLLHCIFCQ